LAEHGHDPEVFRSVLDEDLAGGEWPFERRIDDQLRRWLVLDGNEWR
jgi:hypothetical protein